MTKARTALITGANRGIGLEIAKQLAERGMRVFGTRREAAPGDSPPGVSWITLDVTDAAAVQSLPARFPDGLDALVNNAGIALDGFDVNVVRKTLAVNYHALVNVTDALLPRLRPGARVVNLSSGLSDLGAFSPAIRQRFLDPALTRETLAALLLEFERGVAAGTHSSAGWPSSAYRVSKAAVNAFTRIVARDLAGDSRGILVNAADPGWVRTRMGGNSAPRSVEQGARTPVYLATLPDGGPSGGFFRDETRVAE